MGIVRTMGVAVLATILFGVLNANILIGAENSIYTKQENEAINKFKDLVGHLLTEDFQKSDAHLLRWVRVANYDMQKAAELLKKNLKWRETNDINSLQHENLNAHAKYLPCKVEGVDREGRPIILVPLGKWQLRKYVLAGKAKEAIRIFVKCFDTVVRKVFEISETGKDVDQFYVIGDLAGFTAQEQLCLGCIPLQLQFARVFEGGSISFNKNTTMVNVPRIFSPVLALIRGVFHLQGSDFLHDYDSNKEVWQAKLFKDIDPSQLPKSLGGVRKG